MNCSTNLRFFPGIGFITLLLLGCGREKVAEKYPDGKPKVIRSYGWLGGETLGNLKREQTFFFNGNKDADTRYSHGKRHGPYLDFWHNGQKKLEGRFLAGKKEGEWVFYYNQFTVSARGVFKGDRKEGLWRQFWENGDPKAEGSFHDGKEIGTLKEWSAKGDLMVENSCFEANERGRYRTFHANKTLKEDYACKLGVPVGEYARKDPDGIVVEKGTFDDKGRKEGVWETFHTNGKRASLRHYRQGLETDSSFTWDVAGRLRERGFFVDSTGERLGYDSLGHLIEKQHFINGHPEGESWIYFPTGAKRSVMIYKGGVPAELRKWHPNGKLMAEGVYLNGKRTGEWKEYGENGKLLESSHYQEGILHGEQLFYDVQGKLTRTQRYEHGYPAEGKIPAALAAGLNKRPQAKDSAAAAAKTDTHP